MEGIKGFAGHREDARKIEKSRKKDIEFGIGSLVLSFHCIVVGVYVEDAVQGRRLR